MLWRLRAFPDVVEPLVRNFFPLAGAMILMAAAAPALSQEDGGASEPREGFTGDWIIVGAGITAVPQYEGARHYEALPMAGAIGSVKGVSFRWIGNQIGVDLLTLPIGGRWSVALGPTAALSTNRTHLSVITDRRVRALGKVNPSLEIGASAGLVGNGVLTSRHDRLSLSLSYSRDITGAYDGEGFLPQVSYFMPVSRKAALLLLAQADHADGRYATTYFGISAAQSAASGLPAFAARGGWKSWTAGAAADIALTGDLTHGLSLIAGTSYMRLLGDFAASPVTRIAGSPHQWTLGLGLAYAF